MTAAAIKAELKAAGINTKYINVRVLPSGFSTAVRVTINSTDIDIRDVEAVVKQHERIDRDEYNGEVLMGCNTYTFIDYKYGLLKSSISANKLLDLIDRYSLNGWNLAQLDAAMIDINPFDTFAVMQRVCDIANGKIA